ncbi:2-oxoacid:ferredoxin oxidoreductase subunit beta [Candidatus Woesearchaeota archaeon]|nr:2-oxoacid:ferredoxin oxidoreductase subunit beta [Candidatus Woesearchaeota archaeon]
MPSVADLTPKSKPTWCPGCGDFAILAAVKNAISQLGLQKHEVMIASGIGCSSKLPHWVDVNGFHSIHGRGLPIITGIKLANHKLHCMVTGGDGDGVGIGTNHFIHAMRRNLDITYIMHDNQIYGLTKGQTSPTSEKGMHTKSTPFGVIEIPINPIGLAIVSGATFVAQGYSGNIKHLTELVKQGMQHRGFAFINVLQPCVTFNHVNTFEFFDSRVYNLQEENYDTTNKANAIIKSEEWGERIPIGVFYETRRSTYADELPQLKDQALVDQDISNINVEHIMEYLY